MRFVSIIHIALILILPLVYREIIKWGDITQDKLERVKAELVKLHTDDIEESFITTNDEIVRLMRKEVGKGIKEEITELFSPEKKHDFGMKYDFKYATRDKIQQDITKTIRSGMKNEMKASVKKAVQVVLENKYVVKKYPENLCDKDKKLPPHQKLLVYTVFGTRKLYYEGIPEMLKEAVASNLYHDWQIRIYHDALITPEVKAKYKQYKNLDFCDARKLPRYGDITNIMGKFWRNIPIADSSVDVVCSRDLDSSLQIREEEAVRVFLKSDKLMHTMRDFYMHDAGMLAGMWCMKPVTNRPMARRLLETLLKEAKTYTLRTDQPLLNKVIFDTILDKKKYILQHDSNLCRTYKNTVPFPTQRRDNMEFVGCPNHICNWKNMPKCPLQCRPKEHQDWEYC